MASCDTLASLSDVWYRLGFTSADDLALSTSWVTTDELYQFADDQAKALARATSLFLVYDHSIAVAIAGAECTLPATHIYTESAWLIYAGAPIQQLRLTSTGQLFALDANWATTTGDPTRLSLDAQDVSTAVLYPVPIAVATLAQIMEALAPDVTSGNTTLPLSAVCQDYFSYAMLAGALKKESDSARPEIAAHAEERMKMYEALFTHLWGGGR